MKNAENDRGIFRQEALDAESTRWIGSVVVASPVSHTILSILSIVTAGALLVLLGAGSYTRRENVQGQIYPSAGLVRIRSIAQGVVVNVLVGQGSHVRRGQVLLEVSGDRTTDGQAVGADVAGKLQRERALLEESIKSLELRRRNQKEETDRQRRSLLLQITHAQAELRIAKTQVAEQSELLSRIQPLLEKGFVSRVQWQQQKATASEAASSVARDEGQLASLQQQLDALVAAAAESSFEKRTRIGEAERSKAQVEQQLAKNGGETRFSLRSEVDGVVSALTASPGQAVAIDEVVAAITPDGSVLVADLFLDSSAVGFVQNGDLVTLHYQPFPYQKFGVFTGSVVDISSSPLGTGELTRNYGLTESTPKYRVSVSLPSQTITAYGRTMPLRTGMAVDADVLLDRRRLYEWFFEPILAARRRVEGASE